MTPPLQPEGLQNRATARQSLSRADLASYGLLVLACVAASANLWLGPGIIQTHAGGDSPFLLQRTYELVANLRAGVFPARWMPDAALGLGYPFFSFYAALPYYLAALLNLSGFDLLSAIELTQTLGMLAAAGAMWLYARTLLPKPGALLTSVAYTLAPYHLVNLYVRGDSLQEFFAFAWYPLILWSVDRLIVHKESTPLAGRFWSTLALALALAGLTLTHNVSIVVFAPFIVLYVLARLAHRARTLSTRDAARSVAWLAGAVALALTLTAWFWLPALGEAQGLQLGHQTTGYLDYNNHFRGANLVQLNTLFNYQVDSALNVFAIALPQALLSVLGALVWLRNPQARLKGALILALGILATLMITPLSKPVWDGLPWLALVQFPWRFLSVQALFGALLIGGLMNFHSEGPESAYHQAGNVAPKTPWRQGNWLSTGLFALVCAALALSLPGLPNQRLDIRAEDVTPQSLQQYEWFSSNIGTTIRAEYLPTSAQPRPMVGPDLLQQPRRAIAVTGDVISSTLQQLSPARQLWHINVGSPVATMTVPLLYWPAWHATLTDAQGTRLSDLTLSPYVGSGWAMLSLPQGEHWVVLALDGTPLQHIAEGVSLVTGILVLLLIVLASRTSPRRALRVAGDIAGGMLGVLLIGQVAHALYVPSAPNIQIMDYTERQFANRSTVLMKSGSGATYELTSAHITPSNVQAGETFTLTTQWRDNRVPARIEVKQETPAGGYFAYVFRYPLSQFSNNPLQSTYIAITNALQGPLPLRIVAYDAAGDVYTPTLPSGGDLQQEYLGGLVVSKPAIQQPYKQPIRTFPNGIELRKIDWYQPTYEDMCFRVTWAAARPMAAALQVSFMMRGSDGRVVSQVDSQPQSGLAPTWSWITGVPVLDSYCTHANSWIKQGENYTVQIRWYRVLDQQSSGGVTLVGTRKGDFSLAPETPHAVITDHIYSTPPVQHQTEITFGQSIRLQGYDLLTSTQNLSLTLYWSSAMSLTQDYKLFVHLAPLSTPEPIRQDDRFTLNGMYPTGMWVPGEIISETVTLNLADVPAGEYQLAIGWYDPDTQDRLTAVTDTGSLPDGRYVLAKIQH
jgi:hypothetical protein